MSTIRILRADYSDATHAAAIVRLLDLYARDIAGGGQALSAWTREHVVAGLAARPHAFSIVALDSSREGDERAVGLVNAFEGFSTFAARPLVNVHDVVVRSSHRGRGIAQQMLGAVEAIARERGAVKLTLEVLRNNAPALRLYERIGFAGYALDPSMGAATFMQKWLDFKAEDAPAA